MSPDNSQNVAAVNCALPSPASARPTAAPAGSHDAELQRMAQEQHTILNTITTGVCLIRQRQIQWLNPAFAKMFGYSQSELLGANTSLLYADQEDYMKVGHEAYEALAAGGVYYCETLKRRRDGSSFWCSLSGSVIDPRHPHEGSIWEIRDISKQRSAEEALHNSDRKLAEIFRASPEMIVVSRVEDGRLFEINDTFSRILGYVHDEIIGKTSLEIGLWPSPEARAAVVAQISHVGEMRNQEVVLCKKSGEPIPVLMSASPITIDGDRCMIWLLMDMAERKHAEQERAKLQEQLLQAMKMEAVGRLAGGVAHDFNNLLTVITGNIELARSDLLSSDPLFQQLTEVSKAAESAAALTRQLLAFSRRQIIEPKILNLNELVGNLRRMLTRLIGEDIELRVIQGDGLPSVEVDPGQFDQVVINLAVNARDAMPDGGRLTLETANVHLDEAYAQIHPDVPPGDYVMLAVSDTGEGMTEEVKRRLFEPFFTTKAKGRGTGLGLATIFGIVKQAAGSIEVYSEVGCGTTFKIYLPGVKGPAEQLAPQAQSDELPRGNECILIVEDDVSVRSLAQAFLRRQGYDILVSPSGGDAFLLAEGRSAPIDLLLTDVVMPGMNGRELADRIHKIHPETAVLFTSGYTEDTIVRHGVMDEHMHFIGKPYTFRAIVRKVRQVLDSRAEHAEKT